MDGSRRAVALVAIVFLTSACAIGSRRSTEARLSEDLCNDGFVIVLRGADDDAVAAATVTDPESADRLVQWFHQRPKASNGIGAQVTAQIMSQIGEQFPSLSIQTGHCCVDFHLLASHILVQTRESTAEEWKQDSWEMRQVDREFRDWVLSQFSDRQKKAFLDNVVFDADSEMSDVERASPRLYSGEE